MIILETVVRTKVVSLLNVVNSNIETKLSILKKKSTVNAKSDTKKILNFTTV